MAYTADDLAAIERAILDLGTNKRVVSVTMDGRTVQYGQADLAALLSLRSLVAGEVTETAAVPAARQYRIVASKGL